MKVSPWEIHNAWKAWVFNSSYSKAKICVHIQVIATDGGTPALTAETTVTVVVLDINDNPPQFNNASLNLTIPENEPLGSIIGEFVAIDNDQGLAARLEFIVLGEFAER